MKKETITEIVYIYTLIQMIVISVGTYIISTTYNMIDLIPWLLCMNLIFGIFFVTETIYKWYYRLLKRVETRKENQIKEIK